MSNHITCSRGHFYPANMNKCPFCEKDNGSAEPLRTEVVEPHANIEDDKTRPVGNPARPAGPSDTSTFGGDETLRVATPSTTGGGLSDGDRTQIHRPTTSGGAQPSPNRRKLEGWLVSFTMDPAGVDFKLYEGKNLVGRGSECDIKLIGDSKVSSKHALIVFRGPESVFTDEFASNPSFINEQRVALGDRVALQDGDRIKMGDHEFIFRKVNP